MRVIVRALSLKKTEVHLETSTLGAIESVGIYGLHVPLVLPRLTGICSCKASTRIWSTTNSIQGPAGHLFWKFALKQLDNHLQRLHSWLAQSSWGSKFCMHAFWTHWCQLLLVLWDRFCSALLVSQVEPAKNFVGIHSPSPVCNGAKLHCLFVLF